MKRLKKFLYLAAVVFLLLVLIILGTAIAQTCIIMLSKGIDIYVSEDTLYRLSGGIGTAFACFVFFQYVTAKKYNQLKGNGNFSLSMAAGCAAFCICIRIIVENLSGGFLAYSFPLEAFKANKSSYFDYIFPIFIAPLYEEILFRYGLYHIIKQRFHYVSSVLITAFIFAVLHGYQIQGLISCLVFGVLSAIIYIRTNDIKYCIAAHITCNAFAAIMNYMQHTDIELLGQPIQYDKNGYSMVHPVLFFCAIIISVIYIWHGKQRMRHQG